MTSPHPAVTVSRTPEAAGELAGLFAADLLRSTITRQGHARVIFASAPSQEQMIKTLAAQQLDWSVVQAFHMDEYIGLPLDHPQSFGQWLAHRLPSDIGSFDRIQPGDQPDAERRRYAALIETPVDLVCMGIGVNGHIAFNEPGARFDDPESVRIVDLDQASRQQQVDDGCFADLSQVPSSAVTVTVPPLAAAAAIVCTVIGSRKAPAVAAALTGDVGPDCPASILQRSPQANVFLDEPATAKLPGSYLTTVASAS